MTARSPLGAGYMLNISGVAVTGAVLKDIFRVFGRTSRVNNFSPIFTLNLVSAGQSASGVKAISYGFTKDHLPRMAGEILMFWANSARDKFVLNAGAPGPET